MRFEYCTKLQQLFFSVDRLGNIIDFAGRYWFLSSNYKMHSRFIECGLNRKEYDKLSEKIRKNNEV